MSDISRELDAIVSGRLADDRPIMFELADQVVPVYREFRHDLILTDAVRGMNVGSFLHRILSAEAVQLDVEAPRLLHVANSRWRSLNGPLFEKLLGSLRRVHTKEQIDYIRIFGGWARRALLVTDRVSTGGSMRRLGRVARAAGIRALDYAILSTSDTSKEELARKIRAGDESRICAVTVNHELCLSKPEIIDDFAYFTVYGNPRPQRSMFDSVFPRALFPAAVEKFYRDTANDYIAERLNGGEQP